MVWYAVRPHDTFFIRDGRAFESGSGASAEGVLPHPSTLGGVLGAAIGGRFAALRGPFMGTLVVDGWRLHLPLPRDVVQSADGAWARLRPEEAPSTAASSGHSGEHLLALPKGTRRGDWEHPGGYVLATDLADYLAHPQQARMHGRVQGDASFAFPAERRVGIAREDGSAIDGYLYAATHRRPDHDRAGFLVDVDLDSAAPSKAVRRSAPFGGGGRRAAIEDAALEEQLDGSSSWPQCPDDFPDGRLIVYLATPAIWATGATLPVPDGARLVSAAVGPAQHVAIGWKPDDATGAAKQRSALYWAAPAGSVYHLEFPSSDAARAWALDHHGKALPGGCHADLTSTGFGVILTGKWEYVS